jgi:ubiquinone/menaquinone biosynthesis C-methylase UbiE
MVGTDQSQPLRSAASDHQPDDEYFDVMADVADRHWWYRARRRLLTRMLAGRLEAQGVALDVGCGTGETLTALSDAGAGTAIGTDLSHYALVLGARATGRNTVLTSLAEHLPFADDTVSCVVAMDVIEHLDDDVVALRELVRVARPGATVYLTVPAYPFLWSDHDVRAAHRRRYTRPMLERSVRAAGIEIERSSYYNSFLVAPAVLVRRTPLGRFTADTDEETSMMHPALDRIFMTLSRAEQWWLRRGRMPFGLSIVLIGRTPAAPAPAQAPAPAPNGDGPSRPA